MHRGKDRRLEFRTQVIRSYPGFYSDIVRRHSRHVKTGCYDIDSHLGSQCNELPLQVSMLSFSEVHFIGFYDLLEMHQARGSAGEYTQALQVWRR
jgi:hypothetical protein